MKNWKDVYKLPFKLDSYGGIHVFDSRNNLVFQFDENIENPKSLIKVINDEIKFESTKKANLIYNEKDQCIYVDNEPIISIRGYGYLTGIGGLKLSHNEAAHIQDTLAEYIIEQLNK